MQSALSGRAWIPIGIFAFALLFRLLGIGWGLKNDLHNQSYHPDEPVILAYSQAIEPTRLSFTPGFYNYGTLYLTMLRVSTDMTSAYTGGPNLESDDSYWSWVSRAHLSGRILSALAGAGMALLMFFLAARFLGTVGGLAAGLAIAVAPGHVIHSRFQTVDIIAAFFLTASALLALKLIPVGEDQPRNPMKWVVWSGVLAGLSAGTKYTGILALLTLFAAIGFYAKSRPAEEKGTSPLMLALAGTLAALATFVITTPGILLDTGKFMRDFSYEMTHTSTGHGLLFTATSPGFIYHLGNLFAGMGVLLALTGIGGLIWAAVKKHPWAIALLLFFVAYYFLIGRAEVKFLRYTFPLYIGIAAGFAYVVAESQKSEHLWKRAGVALGILAIGGIDSGGLVASSKATTWMVDQDPRDAAAAWVKSETADQGPVVVGYAKDPWFWSVPFFKDAPIPRMPMGPRYLSLIRELSEQGWPASSVFFLARMAMLNEANQPQPVVFYQPVPAEFGGDAMPSEAPVQYQDFDVRLLTDVKPEYLTLTTLEAGSVMRLAAFRNIPKDARPAVEQYRTFETQLVKDYQLVKIFGSRIAPVEDMQYIQPEVSVWKRKTTD